MKRIFFIPILGFLIFTPGTRAEVGPPGDNDLLASLEPSAIIEEVKGIAPGSSDLAKKPFLVLIQDIHAEPNAQLKIEKTLSVLEEKLGPLRVLLEGGSGAVETQFFRTCPLPDISREVLFKHLKKGELSGAELRASSPLTRSSYEGMEDWALYEDNRQLMREGSQQFSENSVLFERAERAFALLKGKYFSPALLELDHKKEAYEKGGTDALNYINFLMEKGGGKAGAERYPTLTHLVDINNSWTPELNSEAEKEKMALIKVIEQKTRATPKDISDQALVETARLLRVAPEDFKDIEKRSKWTSEMQTIKSAAFSRELKVLEQETVRTLLRGPAEKMIWRSEARYKLFRKLVQFQLSREEYGSLQGDRKGHEPDTIFRSLAAHFPEVPMDATLGWNEWSSEVFFRFYALALKREAGFLERIHASLSREKVVVVVLGGFHAQGILEQIRRESVPHISLLPKTDTVPNTELYLRLMLQGRPSYPPALLEPPQILALATVLTPLSNPEDFRSFVGRTGEEIYDAIRFQSLEERPFEILDEWASAVASSETDQKLRTEYESVLAGLYARVLLAEPAVPIRAEHPDFIKRIRQVNLIFGKLFLENGHKPIEPKKIDRFFSELKREAVRPNFQLMDLILLVYGARWDLPYSEMVERYRKFLRHETLPQDIPEREYLRLNQTVFSFAFPGYAKRLPAITTIYEKYHSVTLRDYFKENSLRDLGTLEAVFAVYARLIPYTLDTPIARIEKDFTVRSHLDFSDPLNTYDSNVPETEIHTALDGQQFKILKDAAFRPDIQQVYSMVSDRMAALKKELEDKYRSVPITDETSVAFLTHLKSLDPRREQDQLVLSQLRTILVKAVDLEKRTALIDQKKNMLAEAAGRLRQTPSAATLRAFRDAQRAVITLYVDAIAFTKGLRRQDVRLDAIDTESKTMFYEQLGLLTAYVKTLKKGGDLKEFQDSLTAWVNSSPAHAEALWKFIRSQNFGLNVSLSIISDQNYHKRRYYPAAFIVRGGLRVPRLGSIDMDFRPLSQEEYLLYRKTEKDRLYFVYEFMETLSRLIRTGDPHSSLVAERVIDGILREEMEGHKFPLGAYDLFMPYGTDIRERLDQVFSGREFDRRVIESDLRLADTRSHTLRERINDEEAVAKFLRGGYDVRTGRMNAEALVQHLASYLFATLGFEFNYSREYFQGEIQDFFYLYYQEFPWIYLTMTSEETSGALKDYTGKTYREAVEGEAVKLFDGWSRVTGASLGRPENSMELALGIRRLLGSDADEVPADILVPLSALARKGEFEPILAANSLLASLAASSSEKEALSKVQRGLMLPPEAEKPLEGLFHWYRERVSDVRDAQVLGDFLKKGPWDPGLLEKTAFAGMINGYVKKMERPGAVHFLPQAVPRSKEGLVAIASLPQEGSHVYFYTNEEDPLAVEQSKVGELIGKIKPDEFPMGVYSTLKKIDVKKARNGSDLLKKLEAELVRGNAKGWGASIFDDRKLTLEELPKTGKGTYLLLRTLKDVGEFEWLAGKIREIGFILPTLTPEEAEKFRSDLTGYGLEFKETPKGFLVQVNLEQLLARIGQEFQAARVRAQAA